MRLETKAAARNPPWLLLISLSLFADSLLSALFAEEYGGAAIKQNLRPDALYLRHWQGGFVAATSPLQPKSYWFTRYSIGLILSPIFSPPSGSRPL